MIGIRNAGAFDGYTYLKGTKINMLNTKIVTKLMIEGNPNM